MRLEKVRKGHEGTRSRCHYVRRHGCLASMSRISYLHRWRRGPGFRKREKMGHSLETELAGQREEPKEESMESRMHRYAPWTRQDERQSRIRVLRSQPNKQSRAKAKTYNSRYSPMVTHSTTNLPIWKLFMAERTECPVLPSLWSYMIVFYSFHIITN